MLGRLEFGHIRLNHSGRCWVKPSGSHNTE